MQTHRQIAKRKALYWQIGAVAILGLAGAAIALPQIGAMFGPGKHTEKPVPVAGPETPKPNYSQFPIDLVSLGAKSVGVQPPPVVAATTTTTPGPETPETKLPPPPTDWAYLGSIITSTKRSALVRVEGQQQIYSVGATHGDAKLVTIEPAYIEVETGGETKKITLNERTMLAPMDPPKHPIAFRQPPTIGGVPAGGPMAFNMPNMGGGRPPPNGPNAPAAATMEQARMAAMAANEAAARAKAAADMPGVMPLEKINPDDFEAASKYLGDASIGDDARAKYLQVLGIGRGTPSDIALNRLREAGVDMNTEAGKHIMQQVEQNAKSKP